MNIASNILSVGPAPTPEGSKPAGKDQPEFNLDFANENKGESQAPLSFDETFDSQTAEILNLLNQDQSTDAVKLPQGENIDVLIIETDTPDVLVSTPTAETDIVLTAEAEVTETLSPNVPTRNPEGVLLPDEDTIDLPNPKTAPRLSPASTGSDDIGLPTRAEAVGPHAQNPWFEGEDMRGGPPSEIQTTRGAFGQSSATVSTAEQQTLAALAGPTVDSENGAENVRGTTSSALDLKGANENRDVRIPVDIQNTDSRLTATSLSSEALAKVPSGIATTFDMPVPVAEQLPVTTAAQSTAHAVSSTAATTPQNVTFTPLPPQSHPALQQVAETLIRAQITQSGLSIRLDPPELGNVSIQFQFDTERNVTAIVRTDVAETSTLLRERAEVLIQALKEQGFDSVNLSFEQSEQDQKSLFDMDGQEHGVELGRSSDPTEDMSVPISEIINPRTYTDGTSVDMKL